MEIRTTLNPLRANTTEMPPNLLLMGKIIALALLCTNHVRLLSDPFLPFIPVLDAIPHHLFQLVLKALFLSSAIALLFNQRVRIAALVLGATILLAVISSKSYYGNNKTFCGLMLLLLGLTDYSRLPYFLRCQFALVYFGAGLNKLLDPDWQSGLFFEHWATFKIQNPLYIAFAPLLPHLLAGKLLCWFTIAAELATSLGLFIKKFLPFALWANILFQASLLEFTGSTFTMFFYGMQAATLMFITWPRHLEVIYDGDCGLCNKLRQIVTRLDFDSVLIWHPYQSGAGDKYRITLEALEKRMHVVVDRHQVFSGFRAFKQIMFFQAWFWLATTALIALPPDAWSTWRRIIVGLTVAVFLPVFNPIGELVYNWVARNRHRIVPNSTCGLNP